MEKLVYISVDSAEPCAARHAAVEERVLPAARSVGGERMALLLPEYTEEIRSRCAGRVAGAFDSLGLVFECWLPSLDDRGAVEAALAPLGGSLWGYLVTESSVVPCPHSVEEGGKVPGVTQWGINDKPAQVSMDDFYHHWQVVHSKLSFDLHPHRESYHRNAIARKLTPDSPTYLGIVLERFPSLDHFTDEALYFGDPAVVKEMIEHCPSFYDFETAITGGMSEYRFG
ncbi:MAG: EthD domain-containing protein [Myxococcota bacterium]